VNLTARQQEILEFIRTSLRHNGMPPTRAEIVAHFGFRSPNAAQSHLRALAARGALRILPGRARGIVAVDPPSGPPASAVVSTLPVVGRVTAGRPVLAAEHLEEELRLELRRFHPAPNFALRVEGDSMIEAGILDGDLLLVHKTPQASTGQIVVARINDEITVKRLRQTSKHIVLEPANPRHRAITVGPGEEFAIEGLAVGVIRSRLPS